MNFRTLISPRIPQEILLQCWYVSFLKFYIPSLLNKKNWINNICLDRISPKFVYWWLKGITPSTPKKKRQNTFANIFVPRSDTICHSQINLVSDASLVYHFHETEKHRLDMENHCSCKYIHFCLGGVIDGYIIHHVLLKKLDWIRFLKKIDIFSGFTTNIMKNRVALFGRGEPYDPHITIELRIK
jgi:hypothetical protein